MQQGEACQTEEVAEEFKGLIWSLVKQVRPGMDLSKVALPTFILEPRSFLDKLSDYYYHVDFLPECVFYTVLQVLCTDVVKCGISASAIFINVPMHIVVSASFL